MTYTELTRNARKLFGLTVRSARESLGMSQDQLSKLSGVERGRISRIEGGRANITLDTITALCFILKIDIPLNYSDIHESNQSDLA